MAKTLTSVRFLRRRFDLHLFFSSSFSSVYYLLWPITLDNDVPLVRSLFSKIYDWLPLVTTCCHSWRRTTMNSMIVIDCSIACSHDWSTSSWYVLLIEPHLKFETNTFQWSVILGSDGGFRWVHWELRSSVREWYYKPIRNSHWFYYRPLQFSILMSSYSALSTVAAWLCRCYS